MCVMYTMFKLSHNNYESTAILNISRKIRRKKCIKKDDNVRYMQQTCDRVQPITCTGTAH